MKFKYKLHPGDYELGENEKFYGDMEAKGWRLVKRGGRFSKFAPVEPSEARYRIEVCAHSFLDAELPGMPEEQLAVFADCGWEHITDAGVLHIFRAPAGSGAPEFYADPAQQAETLKKMKRNALWGWSPTLLWLAVYWGLDALTRGRAWTNGKIQQWFVQLPAFFFALGFIILWELYRNTRNAWIITRTYRHLKKGVPLDHAPQKRRTVHRAVTAVLLSLTALCLLLTAAQLIATRSADLPETADGPYLLLSDLGWEGGRGAFMRKESSVTHSRSLLADYWDTVEYSDNPASTAPNMYQDVYRLRDERMAYFLADALMKSATFGDGGENFAPIETDAVDAAWASRHEVVAVKGPYVACVTYLGGSAPQDFDPQAICQALGEKWQSPKT